MANSDKNIVIRPSIGSTLDQPSITFTGAGNTSITLKILDDSDGTLSFEGYQGQVFAINNNIASGIIYSVNDISGLPLIDANADGTIRLGIYTGNIGIGTTSPTVKLHVVGNSLLGNFSITPVGTGATVGGIGVTYYGDGSNLTGVSGGVSISTNTTNQNQLIPYVVSTGSTTGFGVTADFVFNPLSENLGIGTTNPTSRLHVVGNGLFTGIVTVNSNFVVNGNTLFVDATSNRVGIGTTNPLQRIQVGTANTLGINTNATVFVITSNADVGIGTTNPTSKLHVIGDVLITGVSTFAGITTVTGTTLFARQLNVSGVSTFAGITTNTSTLFANQLSVAGVSTFAGITTNTSTLFANQLSVSGVSTFAGITTNTSTLFANQLSVAGVSTFAGITTVTGTTLFARQLNVSGVSTFAGITTNTSTLFANQLSVSGVSTIGNFRITPVGTGATVGGIGVTYYGDGSNLTGVSGGVSISTNTTNQNQLIPYVTSFGSTTGFGATTEFVFNPSSENLGIGTTNPTSKLHVIGDIKLTGVLTTGDLRVVTGSGTTIFSASGVGSTSTSAIFSVTDFTDTSIIDATTTGDVILTPYYGEVGIGTTNPAYKLDVLGTSRLNGGAVIGTASTTSFYRMEFNPTSQTLEFTFVS